MSSEVSTQMEPVPLARLGTLAMMAVSVQLVTVA